MRVATFRISFAALVVATFTHQAVAEVADVCVAQQDAMTRENEEVANEAQRFSEENPPPQDQPDVCVRGTTEWVKEEFIMHVPEFKLVHREWKMDVPETTVNNKRFSVKEPITVCQNKKIGQTPEFKCDGWKCKTYWTDIITKICWPETRDKEIIIGVPEFIMKTRTFSIGNPEVTMKERKFSYHRLKFNVNEACGGSDCDKMCRDESEKQADAYQSKFDQSIAEARETAGLATSEFFSCQIGALQKSKDEILSEYDKYIAVAEATLVAMREQKLDEAAANQAQELNRMKEERRKTEESIDNNIEDLLEEERKAIEAVAG